MGTLASDEKMFEMEDQLNKIKWDIVGLSKMRRRGESQVTLRSGHLFHYKGDDNLSQGGLGFMEQATRGKYSKNKMPQC